MPGSDKEQIANYKVLDYNINMDGWPTELALRYIYTYMKWWSHARMEAHRCSSDWKVRLFESERGIDIYNNQLVRVRGSTLAVIGVMRFITIIMKVDSSDHESTRVCICVYELQL